MKCNQCPTKECHNEDMKKCKNCVAPMLCLCERPEVRKIVKKLWKEAELEEKSYDS